MVNVIKKNRQIDKRCLQVAATYMGAIIGAGFASGQELLRFFAIHKSYGLVGVGLAGIMFAGLGIIIVRYVNKNKISSYGELVHMLFGEKIAKILDKLISSVLIIGFTVMLVGSGAIFNEQWGINNNITILITLLAVAGAILAGGKGVLWINSVLIPFLVITALIISLSILYLPDDLLPSQVSTVEISAGLASNNWIVAAALYVAYNMILGIVILSSLEQVNSANAMLGTTLGGLSLGVMGFFKVAALLVFFPQILLYQIPMLYLASQISNSITYVYTIALWFAMVTTAVANAYGIVIRLSTNTRLSYLQSLIIVMLLPLPFTQFSFSTLVGSVYPLFGYVGLFLVGAILYKIIIKTEGKSHS